MIPDHEIGNQKFIVITLMFWICMWVGSYYSVQRPWYSSQRPVMSLMDSCLLTSYHNSHAHISERVGVNCSVKSES